MFEKPWYRSLTFWSLIATLIGLALAGIGQGQPLLAILGSPEVQTTIGEILAGLGLGGVLVGRVRAGGPLTLGDGDRRGSAGLGVLVALAVIGAVVAALAGGCIPRQVVAERSIAVDIDRGPPCVVTVTADGAVASTVTGPRCDLQPLPGPTVPPTVTP